jgi:hypothetical protein
MTRYYLWCPEADGTQHLPCPANTTFDHIPTPDEQRQRIIDRRNAGLYGGAWEPDACHFDYNPALTTTERETLKADITRYAGYNLDNAEQFPDGHWTNAVSGRLWAYSSNDAVKAFKALYRCTLHGKKPEVFRRASAYLDRWRNVRDARFVNTYVPAENIAGRWMPALHLWTPRRAAPRTLRDIWA